MRKASASDSLTQAELKLRLRELELAVAELRASNEEKIGAIERKIAAISGRGGVTKFEPTAGIESTWRSRRKTL